MKSNKKQKLIQFLLIALSAFLLLLLLCPLNLLGGDIVEGVEISWDLIRNILAFIVYLFLIILVLSRKNNILTKLQVLTAILVGVYFIQTPILFTGDKNALYSFPYFIILSEGILCGFFIYKSHRIKKIIIILLGSLFFYITYYHLEPMWNYKLTFGSFSGKIEDKTNYDLKFETLASDTLHLSDFRGKYLVVDCWNTYCSVCYEKMPKVQNLYEKYRSTITVLTLHSRMREDNLATGYEILKVRNYTLPCYSIDFENPILKELGVNAYPTVLIFDKNSCLIFRGRIEGATKLIGELMEKEKLQ